MHAHKKRKLEGGGADTRNGYHHSNLPPKKNVGASIETITSTPLELTFLNTFDRESRYPAFVALCDHLPIADIISLTRTCRKLSTLYQILLPLQWNIDRRLLQFVKDPLRFRSMMARCNAIIFGSFATQFFERMTCKSADLSIMVREGEDEDVFDQYLCEVEGYGSPQSPEARTYTTGVEGDLDVWISDKLPIRTVLSLMPSTVVTDIISWNKAYSLFPLITHIQRKGYLLKDLDEYITSPEYNRQGWKIQELMWPEEKRLNHPIRHTRRVGDRYTWTLPLDTKGVAWSKTPDYVLEHACFAITIGGDGRGDPHVPSLYYDTPPDECDEDHTSIAHYRITTRLFSSKTLKYTYLCSNERMRDYIRLRVDRATLMELRKIRVENFDTFLARPHNIHRRIEDLERPDTWTYWDDEFPKWYRGWEQAETKRIKEMQEENEW